MEGCRFCQAGFIYRPLRERKPSEVVQCILKGIGSTGYDDVSLTSLSAGSYHCLGPLLETLMERLEKDKVSLSVSSLRADSLSDTLARQIGRVRRTGFTIAPEAGTQRLRDAINKGITETDILQAVTNAVRNGWHQIKMYFMIGLPTETWEDVEGIVHLAQKVMAEIRGKGKSRRPEITISVSTFVPKPFTPFQWDRMEDLSAVRDKQDFLKESIGRLRLHFKWHDTKTSFLEGVFSRGDRRLCGVLEEAWKQGCRFDSWTEELQMQPWHQAFQNCGIDPQEYLEAIPFDSSLPWDHLNIRISKQHLFRERCQADQSLTSPACGPTQEDLQDGIHCNHCGLACAMDPYRNLSSRWQQDLQDFRSSLAGYSDRAGAAIPGGVFRRYWVRYQKSGYFRFASHLDLIRTICRTLDRSGLNLRHTQGFHPKPSLAFGPALGLGIESTAEWLELELADSFSEEEILERVNSKSPAGLRFLQWRIIPEDVPALPRWIDSAEYLAEPDSLAEGGLPSRAELAERIQSLLGRESILISRKKEGQVKRVEIRPALRSLFLTDREEAPVLGFILAMNGAFYARPEEVLEALLGGDAERWQIRRNASGLSSGQHIISPLDFINSQWTGAKEKLNAKRANCQQ